MVSSNRLRSAFNKATRGNEKRNTYRAKLGDFNRRLQTGRTNYVWARVQLPDGLSVTEVLCMNVAPTLNLDVLVEYNEYDKLEVKKLDPVKAPEFFGDLPGGNVGAHGWSHGRLAPDAMKIDPLQIDGLLVTPTDPASSAVQMGSWFYQSSATSYEWWAGGTVDLAGYIPTDSFEQRPVIVGLNRSTGSPQVLVGTTGLYVGYTPYQIPFNGSDVAAIVGSADFEASAGVRLRYGMGSVEAYDLFLDCRRWVGGGISTGGGGGGGSSGSITPGYSQLRLTTITGDPVPEGNNSASATLYFTNYEGWTINVYNTTSSEWEQTTVSGEVSASIAALTASRFYDVFYDSSETLTFVDWGGTASRSTALGDQDGIEVMASDKSKLYVGTIYIDSGGGTCTQNLKNLRVWNRYNRVDMPFVVTESTNTWLLNSTTVRAANNSTANSVAICKGLDGNNVSAHLRAASTNPAGNAGVAGIGLNTSTAISSPLRTGGFGSYTMYIDVDYEKILLEGLNTLYWVEVCTTTGGNVTFFGDIGSPSYYQTGMTGHTQQ